MASILNKSAAILDFQVAHRADLTSSPQRIFVPNLVLVSQFARLVPLSALLLLLLSLQFSVRQVVPDAPQSPPHRSSSPSFPRHVHPHHYLAHILFFSSQYRPTPLQLTFLHFLGYFSHLRRPSNYFISNSVQLGGSIHTSWHPHFRHIQLIPMSLHCPFLGTAHHCWSYNRLVHSE